MLPENWRKRIKILTVSQPWAGAIVGGMPTPLPPTGPKWVENRTWRARWRGPLIIHAGKSDTYSRTDEIRERFPGCETWPTGVALGMVNMVDCVNLRTLFGKSTEAMSVQELKIFNHPYAERTGWGLILDPLSVYRFARPLECPGKLGIWTPPEAILDAIEPDVLRWSPDGSIFGAAV